MIRPLALSLTVFVAACGGGGGGGGDGGGGGNPNGGGTPGPVTAAVEVTGALSFQPAGWVAASSTASPCGITGTSTSAVVLLATSYPLTCGTVAENRANSTQLVIVIARTGQGGQPAGPIEPRAYALRQDTPAGEPVAFVGVRKKDASCGDDPASLFGGSARSGTVTITAVGATVDGTVDALLNNGDRVAGTFSIPVCTGATGADVACIGAGRPPAAGECRP